MHQHLEVKRLRALVLHLQRRLQTVPGQGDAVHEPKLERPRLAELVAQHGVGEAKVELDGVAAVALFAAQRLRGRLAQELPVRVAREAVLRQGGGGVVFGWGAEDLYVIFHNLAWLSPCM